MGVRSSLGHLICIQLDTHGYPQDGGWSRESSKNNGIPKSSNLTGFSIINHPFWWFSKIKMGYFVPNVKCDFSWIFQFFKSYGNYEKTGASVNRLHCSVNRIGDDWIIGDLFTIAPLTPFKNSRLFNQHSLKFTWHPKIMVARLISLGFPGICYASFIENIHSLNSNSGLRVSNNQIQRKKHLLNVWTHTPFLK